VVQLQDSRRSQHDRDARQPHQGDVAIVSADSIPADATLTDRDQGRIVLAYGEVTGHAHAITDPDAELYTDGLNDRFLRVLAEGGVTLDHEEHSTIVLPPGDYRVIQQREFDLASGQVRVVAD
jgi:hypothetical protein